MGWMCKCCVESGKRTLRREVKNRADLSQDKCINARKAGQKS